MLKPIQDLLHPLLGLEVPAWLLATLVAAATGVFLFGVRKLLVGRLSRLAARTDTGFDDLFVDVLRHTRGWFLVLLSLAVGTTILDLSATASRVIGGGTVLVLGLQAGLWLTTLLAGAVRLWFHDPAARSGSGQSMVGVLRFLVQLVVWSGVVLLVLANFGVDVTALVAGLGVGGIAVALAVQNILGDLFASLSIVLDEPFVIGDFIIVDDLMGKVEHIGLKTTRVRSLTGEQLIFSNTNLLSSRIRNYQRMRERRIAFTVGVTYETPPALVREVPGLIQASIVAAPLTRFDRAHFKEFADSVLLFEAVYYVLDPDFNRYMDVQQQINLGLLDSFAAKGIEFAYPTQTVHLAKV